MNRRNLLKIVSAVSAGAATTACDQKRDALIPLLVPEHEIPQGEERWRPSVCQECSAGCGIVVRVMEGERVIEKNGHKFRQRIACAKKIEGNPLDSVSGGRLCAHGHASLQSLYNPDRVRGPMKRSGTRGQGRFTAVSWDEAIGEVAKHVTQVKERDPKRIAFLTSYERSLRALHIQQFLSALRAPPAVSCSVVELAVERRAAQQVFGWDGVPRYDLGNARDVLGVGADFLGGWASPVFYGRQFGQFRQGRSGLRGRLVQAESRMSLTAANADEWIPVRPGWEPFLLVAIAQVLVREKLVRESDALPDGAIDAINRVDVARLFEQPGVEEKRIHGIAVQLGQSEAPLVIGGASIVQSNSLDTVVLSHLLNVMLGNINKPGGLFPPGITLGGPQPLTPPEPATEEMLQNAEILFLHRQNPAYLWPKSNTLRGTLERAQLIVSFGDLVDETSSYADWILPDHNPLEAEGLVAASVAGTPVAFAYSEPVVQPLYDTRMLRDVLSSLAKDAGTPFDPVSAQNAVQPLLSNGTTWNDVMARGGLWHDIEAKPAAVSRTIRVECREPSFTGAADQFPLRFQPYPSLQFRDGQASNLPWMQELPDPVSSAMWGLPVELDPHTAAGLQIVTGDRVRVESPHGSLEAAAYVHPAALPGVVSMAMGQGHTQYGRFATGRGANPLAIIAGIREEETKALAFGATRVRLAKLNGRRDELIQFSPQDREAGPWGYR